MDSSVVAHRTSRKRKKHTTGNSSNSTLKKQKLSRNSDDSRDFVKKKKPFANKHAKSNACTTDIQNSSKQKLKSINTNMAKKVKKNLLKPKDIADTKSKSLIESKHIKSKKNKKFKKVPGTVIQVSQSVSKDKSISPVKKKVRKGKKKIGKLTSNLEENASFESDDELSVVCVSDDNESDEEDLREEIKNSSIFKQISKLMKNPVDAGVESSEDLIDEDMDNSSDFSLSVESEDEDGETDDQKASSSESDLEDSILKNKPPSKKDTNVLPTNKKNNFSKTVSESAGFNRTAKDNALRRNTSDNDKKGKMSSNLKNKVQEKLAGAKFRFLNEKLYTETGKEAFKYFQENTEEFEDYHSGYRIQVSKWPMNPVNEIIADIQRLKKSLVIADLGCGEAKIAQTFPNRTVHSFDLVPLNEFVKACDISKIPLPNESVDVVVFCLSLMGTNLKDYLCEAFRILKLGGILKIAEVESRIEDLGHFINYLKSIGFKVERKNTKHKMFIFLDLKKQTQKCKVAKIPSLSLRPCLYKKR